MGQKLSWAEAVVPRSLLSELKENWGFLPSSRPAVTGPEQKLVQWFLEAQHLCLRGSYRLTVFLEPMLQGGDPDIVAVVWRYNTMRNWKLPRLNLKKKDIKLLHFLAMEGATAYERLHRVFPRDLESSLKRLTDADVILRYQEHCRARSLNQIFAIRDIISVEAKASSRKKAVQQAFRNTWFSSKSYILIPQPSRRVEEIEQAATKAGVGIFHRSDSASVSPAVVADTRDVPRSYASWLFNEWIWRLSVVSDEEFSNQDGINEL